MTSDKTVRVRKTDFRYRINTLVGGAAISIWNGNKLIIYEYWAGAKSFTVKYIKWIIEEKLK